MFKLLTVEKGLFSMLSTNRIEKQSEVETIFLNGKFFLLKRPTKNPLFKLHWVHLVVAWQFYNIFCFQFLLGRIFQATDWNSGDIRIALNTRMEGAQNFEITHTHTHMMVVVLSTELNWTQHTHSHIVSSLSKVYVGIELLRESRFSPFFHFFSGSSTTPTKPFFANMIAFNSPLW